MHQRDPCTCKTLEVLLGPRPPWKDFVGAWALVKLYMALLEPRPPVRPEMDYRGLGHEALEVLVRT